MVNGVIGQDNHDFCAEIRSGELGELLQVVADALSDMYLTLPSLELEVPGVH